MISIHNSTITRSLRLLVATIGGYAFAAGFVAVVAAGLPHIGMVRTESSTLGGMLGILIYLIIIIWAVASPKPIRTAMVIFIAAAMMIAIAPLLVVA